MAARGCFVSGTDTGAGKTILAAALCAAIRASGARVAGFKPVVTGVQPGGEAPPPDAATPGEPTAAHHGPATGVPAPGEPTATYDGPARGAPAPGEPLATAGPPGAWPADHELLAAVTGSRPEDVTTRTFAPAVSPHLAAELAGATISLDALVAAAEHAAAGADVLVVEGVGGLLVPLSDEHDIRDLAVALGMPVVIAARPGLGTISHSLLTIEAARAAGLDVRAVVLTPWPQRPSVMERSNRATIARRGEVEVATLRTADGPEDLAAAGATLAWAGWLGGVSS